MFIYKEILNQKKYDFKNRDRDALFNEVTAWLRKMNINYTDKSVYAKIDRQSRGKVTVAKKISLTDALQGAKAIVNFTLGNAASPQEQTRRQDICIGCPLMKTTSSCATCGTGAAKAIKLSEMIRKHKKSAVTADSEIRGKFCGICDCLLHLMVVTKYEDIEKEDPAKNSTRPDFCWLKTTSPNFTRE